MILLIFFIIAVFSMAIILFFIRTKSILLGDVSYMFMKFFLILLILSLFYCCSVYSKALSSFFGNIQKAAATIIPENIISTLQEKCPSLPSLPIGDVLSGKEIIQYLLFMWLCVAILLIPFPFLIQTKKYEINTNGTQIVNTITFFVYNIPIYLLSFYLLFCYIAHLLNLAGNACNLSFFFNDYKESASFLKWFVLQNKFIDK